MEAEEPLSLDYLKSHGPWHLALPSPVSVGELGQMTSEVPSNFSHCDSAAEFSCNAKHKIF